MTNDSTFEHLRTEPIAALGLELEEYRHIKTGAQHIHIKADNTENVFLVALRTVPENSKGVAHILEHTALCGSEKYPVRDPFFMMIRRSLNSFMNAFTSSDWTAYPFASQNKKDFSNLLDVYLDAVFFPNLDPLDFAQEGHRLEFSDISDADSELLFKGVVFNEMKGAMSAPTSVLWQAVSKYLYPTTTYHHNSGGEPEEIPNLSYQELIDFHREHYHPSNAIFMTFGDIPAAEHQATFEARALHRFERSERIIAVTPETRYQQPIQVSETYAADKNEDNSHKTHLVVGWLLGESTNLDAVLEAQILSSILMENSASPLLKALETTDLGQAPSPLCGVDDSQREICFVCGLEGIATENAAAVETMILECLQEVIDNGVEQDILEASLHQLELQRREITGDSYPYGLQLILSSLSSATHRGDPVAPLDIDRAIANLKGKIQAPNFLTDLINRLLINNPHRVRLALEPDVDLAEQKNEREKQRLDAIKAALSDDEKQAIIQQALALKSRQEQTDDPSVLPKVGLEDVEDKPSHIAPTSIDNAHHGFSCYAAGTNGLIYQQMIVSLPELNSDEQALLPYLSQLFTELGAGEQDYLALQNRQTAVTGGISAYSRIQGAADNVNDVAGRFVLSCKALVQHPGAATELMHDIWTGLRFDEPSRVQEIIAQLRARAESSITGNGHSLAMTAAAQHLSPTALLAQKNSGLAGIRALKNLDERLKSDIEMNRFLSSLKSLHQKITAQPVHILLISEQAKLPSLVTNWQHIVKNQLTFAPFDTDAAHHLASPDNTQINDFWETNSQVNFCAKAYPTVPTAHPDAAALTVLGGFLRNNYLHRKIREQGGAYGGGASQDNYNASFRFYSYRDPRFSETLTDFDSCVEWFIANEHDNLLLEEAILGVVSSLDKPGSPAGEVKQAFGADIFGRTADVRDQFRARVLATTIADLKRVAGSYLKPELAHTAVVSHEQMRETAEQLGMKICRI